MNTTETRYFPCTGSKKTPACRHLGSVHTPVCIVCGCPEHVAWTPPPLLPDVTDEERARQAVRVAGEGR